jgi:cell division inhibitor SulA/protein ImuA
LSVVAEALPLAALLARTDIRRGCSLARVANPSVPTGFPRLDAELPGGGWPAGSLTEFVPAHDGIGELRILGPALARLARAGERLAWIAPPYLPYAPALVAAGIPLGQVLIVRAHSARDALWAAEQALRSAACGAVLVWPGEAKYAALRRLQLAAESTRAVTLLFRAPRAAAEASPAALRLALDTAAGGIAVRILKRRGAVCARPIAIDLDRPHAAMDSAVPAEPAARSADARACHA